MMSLPSALEDINCCEAVEPVTDVTYLYYIRLCAYRAVNTFHLSYKKQYFKVV